MKARPLICHIIHRLATGGLENGLVNLINHLPRDRYRHAVVCLTESTDFGDRIRHDAAEIYAIHKLPGKDLLAYARLWRLLRRLKPRIVHTRNLPALDTLFIAWLARVPRLVHSEHGLDMIELDGRNRKYNRLRRVSCLIVDQYIAVSRNLYDWLHHDIGVAPSRLALIYNGVDTGRFTPDGCQAVPPPGFVTVGSITVGTIGRFESVKHPQGLAEAICHLLEMRPDLRRCMRAAFVGDGALRLKIKAVLAGCGALDLAWLPGFRNDTPEIYRLFDIFVLPSLREGISNTALEAMASGRPVVATRTGGNPEIVPDGVAGILVPPGDPKALAGALLHYIDNPDLRRDHGLAARAHVVKNFSLNAMVENYDKIYSTLLSTP
jgi:sugar transferase (PEP-CTERM/EpsH1 system associated)